MLTRAKKKLLGQAAAAFDRAAVLAAYAQTASKRRNSKNEAFSHEQRVALLGRLARRYRSDDFFRAPREIALEHEHGVRELRGGGRVVDIRWPSDYTTYLPELLERYDRRPSNRLAAARLWLHDEPRPVAVLVHGYMAGQYAVEERMWPSKWLFHKLGMVLAFFVLPFHGVRSIRRRIAPPPFPGSDPRLSNEGFRQAMADFCDLVRWLRARGHASVGAMGMSLGGYTTALATTVAAELAFAVPVIPLTSLADFARDQGRLGPSGEQCEQQHRALDAVHEVVSPLHH